MINKQKNSILTSILVGICILVPFFITFFITTFNPEIQTNYSINNREEILKPSIYPLSNIYINNNDEDNDWDEFANQIGYEWCTKTGGVYYIKNVVITGGGSIRIQHSDVNFVIENCTVINSNDDGVRLRDVENGILRCNNFSNNTRYGIYVKYMEWTEYFAHYPFKQDYEDSSNNIEIWNNTVNYNSDNGIFIEGKDNSLTCDNNNITGNTIINNSGEGISVEFGDTNTIVNNTCLSNGESGIYIKNNNGDTINENNCSYNTFYGIRVTNSDGNTINDNYCNYNYNGILLANSDDNIINGNNANNNDEVGLYLSSCYGVQSEWSNEISGNIANSNNIGIHLENSEYNYVGTGNGVNGNTQYGIYLSEASANNIITGNIVDNNGQYDICYTYDCHGLNIFLNNGVGVVNLGSSGTGPGGFDPQYLYAILFILGFIAMIGGISYARMRNRNRMRDAGVVDASIGGHQRVVFVRPGVVYSNQPTEVRQQTTSTSYYEQESDNKPITPKEIEPYEFYCANCDQKSLGYQVFCPTCGERMKQPKLASMHNPDEKIQCVICHTDTCSTCGHSITGEDACYEECPYCERSYHKHCWNKTMQTFGKCGFCLETPPPELIPNVYKSQNDAYYQDP